MKKIHSGFLFLLAIIIGFLSAPAHAIGLKGGINWDMSTSLGKYKQFTDMFSYRGASIWLDLNLTKRFSVGIDIGYHQSFENKDRNTFEYQPGQVFTASTYNTMYDIPIMATFKYTIIARGIIHPYVGIGAGAVYTRQEIIFLDMAIRDKSWNFGLAPTVGIQLTLGKRIPLGFVWNKCVIRFILFLFYKLSNLFISNLLNECFQPHDVFDARSRLESAVEVDACQPRMPEAEEGFCAFGTQATAQEERCFALIPFEQRPVERLSRTAVPLAAGVEQQVVDHPFIRGCRPQIFRAGDGQGFDERIAAFSERIAFVRRFPAV